ncbi:hypothetical protein HU200_055215 [Digitaria exilis]|uniref:non-specific serine/threonine protein kinase n=1 Tax=Digitaria exilis TaxID=1010633 RepID=A0A835AP81_9POAL|nr:hypothetical protein HU200_055215 [Digitaria exilis]
MLSPKLPSVSPPPPPPYILLLFLLTTTMAVSPAAAWLDCGDASPSPPPSSPSPSPQPAPPPTTNATSSSDAAFRANLLTLLGELPRAAAATGFASLSLGSARRGDRAFVRGLCRGDFAPPRCLAELQAAVGNLAASSCFLNNSHRRAALWLDVYIAYGDTNASTPREDALREILYDTRLVADPAGFKQAYTPLMSRLVARAVASGGGGSGRRPPFFFATGEARYDASGDDPNGTMYGMVQCMRDMTAEECERCLNASVPRLPCGSGNQGGVVLAYNCFLRIQVYTYYDLALDAPAPAPVMTSPPTPAGETSGTSRPRNTTILAVVFPLGTLLLLAFVLTGGVYLRRRRGVKDSKDDCSATYVHPEKFTLAVLRAATGNFAAENKLGEGAVAVKRLSRGSSQGFHELKNELVIATKLTHRNLVQLLGVCLEETEKLIVYEYLPNRSLDNALFGTRSSICTQVLVFTWIPIPTHDLFNAARRHQRKTLDWRRRYAIIRGIARGLLYLHEESRLRIIHRDLKPSNVLLDSDMSPKISDFGLARAFWGDETIREVTKRPVGTLGYMSPEYAYYGHVSTKSDMFSFGVIEHQPTLFRRWQRQQPDELREYNNGRLVWEKWRRGSVAEIVDASLGGRYAPAEALACAQKEPGARPDAAAVVLMLEGQSAIQRRPSRPAFCCSGSSMATSSAAAASSRAARGGGGKRYGRRRPAATDPVSENGVTVSELEPR